MNTGGPIDRGMRIFTTCPPLGDSAGSDYLRRVVDVARWSEEWGCAGLLVYTDNSQLDPWLVAQHLLQHTRALCPLVAVQPIYMHPYAVAKIVSTLSFLYGRRVCLNMVAGGFKNDLMSLNDTTPHDQRYDRLVEYTLIIKGLLAGRTPVTFDGRFYKVGDLRLQPHLPPGLFPQIMLSGSSPAGLNAARQTGAVAIHYPKPASEYRAAKLDGAVEHGIRVGVVSRPDGGEAWQVARRYFPEDRRGRLTHELAMRVSDSAWHRELSSLKPEGGPYWLVPFENYKTMCPYLVGSYESVAAELAAYMAAGYRTFILDVPPSADELRHTQAAFARAMEVTWPTLSKTG